MNNIFKRTALLALALGILLGGIYVAEAAVIGGGGGITNINGQSFTPSRLDSGANVSLTTSTNPNKVTISAAAGSGGSTTQMTAIAPIVVAQFGTNATTSCPTCIATNTGNWAGTWQGVNSTTFYLASNPSGFITSAPATSTIIGNGGTATGPAFTFVTSTASGIWNVTSSGSNVRFILPSNLGFFTNDSGFISLASLSGLSPISYNNGTGAFSFVNPGYLTATSSVTWTALQTFTGGLTVNSTATFNSSTIMIGSVAIGTSTLNGALNILGAVNQAGGAVSLASTTINGNATTTGLTITGIAASNCLHTGANGVVSGTGADCGSGGGSSTVLHSGLGWNVTALSGGSQTGTIDTTAALTWTGAQTFNVTTTFNSSTILAGSVSSTEVSALILANASGVWGSYGGASACAGGQAVTTISAVGGTTCSAFMLGSNNLSELTNTSTARTNLGLGDSATLASSTWFKVANNLSESTNTSTLRTNIGYSGGTGVSIASNGAITNTGVTSLGAATGTVLVGAYLSGGQTLNVSSTLPSSSVAFLFYTATTTSPYNFQSIRTNTAKTIARVDCTELAAATDTIELAYSTSSATSTAIALTNPILASLTCGVNGANTSTFTTASLPIDSYLFAIVSSTAGTPSYLNINVSALKL